MTARRILAIEIRRQGWRTMTMLVSPPVDPGDVYVGHVVGPQYVFCKSVGLPTAEATMESLRSQLAGFGWDGLPSAEELMKLAKEG